MSRHSVGLSLRKVARLSHKLIARGAEAGWLIERLFESVRLALVCGDGYAHVVDEEVLGYAECRDEENYHTIHSVIVLENAQAQHIGIALMQNRLDECFRRNPDKNVILACSPDLVKWYKKFGFLPMAKENAPECIRGGRGNEEWKECNRIWMMCTMKIYLYKKEKEFPSS